MLHIYYTFVKAYRMYNTKNHEVKMGVSVTVMHKCRLIYHNKYITLTGHWHWRRLVAVEIKVVLELSVISQFSY